MGKRARSLRRSLERDARAVKCRLADAVGPNLDGSLLGRVNIDYEYSERSKAVVHGGVGMIARMIKSIGLAEQIDKSLHLLKVHRPYSESDHVLNIMYNTLCGGTTLDEIEHRRNDAVFLDGLGVAALPDPTTAGDFCRRFSEDDIWVLQDAISRARSEVWCRQPASFFAQTARIDVDATIVETSGETKEGMNVSYNGKWGYSALVVSLANTQELLYLGLRGANRPSHEGAPELLDKAIHECRSAGFADVLLRGDTDYALTGHFDRWDADGVRFIFGIDATGPLKRQADDMPEDLYQELVTRAEQEVDRQHRTHPYNYKQEQVRERRFRKLRLKDEQIVEFSYRPGKCAKKYRVVALRKNISVERGDNVLFDEIRYFFYITNDQKLTADEVVMEARQRCNQENLHAQLKGNMRALHAAVNTLIANLAYMVMASLAWNIKAWTALLLPISPRRTGQHIKQRDRLLAMEFRTFRQALINIPCQIIKTGRRVRWRIQAWNPWLPVFFRLLQAF